MGWAIGVRYEMVRCVDAVGDEAEAVWVWGKEVSSVSRFLVSWCGKTDGLNLLDGFKLRVYR